MTTVRNAVSATLAAAARRAQSLEFASPRNVGKATYAVALSVLGFSGIAAAQQAAPASGASAQQPVQLQEVEVTGSRIKRTTDFNTSTPTTVIDTATMESLGIVNVGQTLALTPANSSTFTPTTTGNSNYFTGTYIADLRGLNPYFGSRTLVLIDGQRAVQTEQGDQFDLNFIPQILVSRIDTVTGGASAAYGSGAIAGVENVIMNDKLEGGKLDGDFYQTSHSDGRDRHIGAAYGLGLMDNRFHFVIGGEYEASDAVGCQDARSWCAQDQGAYETGTTPYGTSILGYGSNIRTNYYSPTGVILPGSVDLASTPAGAYNVNAEGNGVSSYGLGGGLAGQPYSYEDDVPGGQGEPIYQYTNLAAPVNRGVGMAILTGKINDYINFKTTLLLGRTATTDYNGTVGTYNAYISPDNAFIQNDPTLQSAIGTGAYIDKDWSDQVPSYTRFTTNMSRFTFGLNGQFGDSTWTWDANYENGLTHHQQLVTNNYTLYAVLMGLDSVINPATGQAECRVTLDGYANAAAANPAGGYGGLTDGTQLAQGCQPLDPFGTEPLSQSAVGYNFGNLVEDLRYEQTDANFNTSGQYFSGIGAGPFTAAFGYEWRQERGDNIDQPGAPAYLAQDFETQYGSSFGGVMSVNEEYLETNIPLLRDKPGAHLLEFDVAARESEYANTALYGVDVGSTNANQTYDHEFPTWKFSGIYEPVDWFRLRASQSRDERAPNFRELYYNQVIGAGGIYGQCEPGSTADPCSYNLLGNVDLKPETSNTTTIGFVLTPRDLLPGFQFSADYFHIKITNAIEPADPELVELGCKAGVAQYCNQMTFVPGSGGAAAYAAGAYNVTSLNPTSYNGAFYEVRGVDFSFNYLLDLQSWGTLDTRLLTTWYGEDKFQEYGGGPVFNMLGQTGNGNDFTNDYTPDARWNGTLMVTWAKGPWSFTPNMRFVSEGTMDFLGITPGSKLYTETLDDTLPTALQAYGFHPMPYNYVPSYFVFGLNVTYQFQDVGPFSGLQVFTQVDNLFNKTPPYAGGASLFGPANATGGTNPIWFDTMGLAYRVGFRMNF